MIDLIPESYQYLLKDETKAFAWVATVNPRGGPQLTSVWFNTDGEQILFNTTDKSAKFRYLKANPRIALAIVDPTNAYKYVQVRGKVEVVQGPKAVEHTHALSRKYTGKDFELRPGFERVMYKVTPKRVTLWPPQR
jgi:PPOX class probable F420-dependent enzyme